MKLPKRDLPHYQLTLPESGKVVTYRPYTIREKKLLAMSLQGGDAANAVMQVIENCVSDLPEHISDADFEFIAIKLIAASTTPIYPSNINYDCGKDNCPKEHGYGIDLNQVNIEGLKNGYTKRKDYYVVPFNETSGACMRYTMSKPDPDDTLFNSVVSIYENDIVYDEFDKESLLEYLDSLTDKEYQEIEKFINNQPYCSYIAKTNCRKCNEPVACELKGILDFLA